MPPQLLAGPAANFDFWTDEVAHCLAAIDGYEERFQRMLAAQHERLQADSANEAKGGVPFIPPRVIPRPGRVPDQLRQYVRAELCRAYRGFAVAAYHQAHIDSEVVHIACQRLSIDLSDSEVPHKS